MGEKVKIKVKDKRHVFDSGTMLGLAIARQTLEEANSTLPGMGLARALIDAQLGERRAAYLLGNLKAVSEAGHDIQNVRGITSLGDTEIEIEFYDLADLAEKAT